ncbi:hypothetical protein CL622_02340 [archaeon]|nr:hypothetical protein [archaeon]|tara:strand:+ start:3769 stop:4500 length:732 start_codon:yes stop_codon:yes gene_type:complete
MSFLNVLLNAFLFFFLPGFVLWHVLRLGDWSLENITIIIFSSLAVSVLLGTMLGFFGYFSLLNLYILIILVSILIFILFRYTSIFSYKNRPLRKSGQYSTEFILLIAGTLLLLIGSVVLFFYFSSGSQNQTILNTIEFSLTEFVQTGENIYALSEGSRTRLTVRIPSRINQIRFDGNEAFATVQMEGTNTIDVTISSKVEFFPKTFSSPAPGRTEYLVGTQLDPSDDKIKVCVVPYGQNLDCV